MEPAFSTRAIVDAVFPDAVVTGRNLPDGIQEIVSMSLDGPRIIYKRGLSTPEQRFVIAHALAHLAFDAKNGQFTACLQDPLVEKRADDFAAELLVPLEYLREYVGRFPVDGEGSMDHEAYLDQVDEIASHFHVPSAVVDQQIRRLSR